MGGQDRQPFPLQKSKQARVTTYFGKKSPKAKLAQARAKDWSPKEEDGENEMESTNTNI